MFTRMRLGRSLCVAGVMLTLGGATLGVLGATTYATSVGPGTTVYVGNPNYSTAGGTCDPDQYRDGYHFIMNGLEYPVGSVINAADFGPIMITFSDSSTAVATFTDLAGPVAHFLNNTINQTGNFTIVSAQTTFPAGTDITGFNQFRISHPPCGTVTTTTTDEYGPIPTDAETPTTDEYGPIATEPETITTEPVTSNVASEFPLPPTTPTTIAPNVASEAPTVPPTLPATGTRTAGAAAMLGLGLLTAGLVVSGLSRRPRSLES